MVSIITNFLNPDVHGGGASPESEQDHERHNFMDYLCNPDSVPRNPYINEDPSKKRDYLILTGFNLDPERTPRSYWIVSTLILVLLFLGFILLAFFIYRSQKLIKLIKSPQQGSTYCILTTCIIRSLQGMLAVSIIIQFFRVIFVCLGDKFEGLILKQRSTFWIYYIYQISIQFVFPITDLTYLMQTIEWVHVIFIICHQSKLSIGHIMFQQVINADMPYQFSLGIRSRFQHTNNFRQSEERISFFYAVFTALFILQIVLSLSVKFSCTNLQRTPPFYSYKDISIQIGNIILKTVVVAIMLHLMRKRANFTFNEKIKGIVIYYLLDTLSFIISSTNFFILTLKNDQPDLNVFQQLCLVVYYLNLHTILAAYSILYLKSSQDIINDVNKLQDVYRVSQFQKPTQDDKRDLGTSGRYQSATYPKVRDSTNISHINYVRSGLDSLVESNTHNCAHFTGTAKDSELLHPSQNSNLCPSDFMRNSLNEGTTSMSPTPSQDPSSLNQVLLAAPNRVAGAANMSQQLLDHQRDPKHFKTAVERLPFPIDGNHILVDSSNDSNLPRQQRADLSYSDRSREIGIHADSADGIVLHVKGSQNE